MVNTAGHGLGFRECTIAMHGKGFVQPSMEEKYFFKSRARVSQCGHPENFL
jgi:hypothetical protein